MIVDKGTLDAIGLRPNAQDARRQYRRAVATLLQPGGLLVITSCNSSKDELVCEFTGMTTAGSACPTPDRSTNGRSNQQKGFEAHTFGYLDHVRTYPAFKFGGQSGSTVCTVAFQRQ